MNLQFRHNPGCRERHLRRKLNNPLFPADQRYPSQQQLEQARRGDNRELTVFMKEVQQLVRQISALQATAEAASLIELKRCAYQFYEQCTGLPGDQAQVKMALRQLIDELSQALHQSTGGDDDSLRQLAREERARDRHFALLEYPLTGDLLRKGSPVSAAELVPTLLSESDDQLGVVLDLFKTEDLKALIQDARSLIARRRDEGLDLAAGERRLACMERLLDGRLRGGAQS